MAEGPDEIRQAIEETRAEIGDTVDALVAKADVKGRATAKAHETLADAKEKAGALADRVTSGQGSTSDTLIGSGSGGGDQQQKLVVAAGISLFLILVVRRRRRRRR